MAPNFMTLQLDLSIISLHFNSGCISLGGGWAIDKNPPKQSRGEDGRSTGLGDIHYIKCRLKSVGK